MDIRDRLDRALLYLVTPSEPGGVDLDDFLPRVLEAGVDMVQLREKDLEDSVLLIHAETARRRAEEFGAIFLLNDRADLAVASGAHGLHIGQDDLPIEAARKILGDGPIIGLSTHSSQEILDAQTSGADYIGVGPVHATPTKPGRPAVGYELVEFAADRSSIPFYAIGGMDLKTLPEAIEAGARRVSVLRAVTEAQDPAGAVRTMKRVLLDAHR